MALPAPAPSHTPLAHPVTVVGSQFMAPYPVELVIAEKMLTLKEGTFTVTDTQENIIFKVKGSIFSLHDRRTLLDPTDKPILSFRQKIMTMHRRWQIYRGESSDAKDLLFTVKKSSVIQFNTDLDVFLSGNTNEEVPDFKIKGSWFQRSCTIFLGDGTTAIAQMHAKNSASSVFLGKDAFRVTVFPNVDYALVVAFVVVLHEVNADRVGDD
ncbi:protein LURP-one-related 15-like [Humulus lupulus]|uniref:protein LURP-one-related 15-like n=1 Tax=Humulus lupulus TaxID=3486 RepID=UPI002B41651F|nr:protein LURP-one-related 15-like [Humulus lupulus]